MSDQPSRKITSGNGNGFFESLSLRIKLILRLMTDTRVNPLLKLLPIGALLYWIIPEPLFGPIDDALILWLGTTLFVELCPQTIVQEHRDILTSVIDVEWREVEDDEDSKPDQPSLPGQG